MKFRFLLIALPLVLLPAVRSQTAAEKIGLIFAKEVPRNEVHVAAVAQPRLKIPPGEANHIESKRQVIPVNMIITAVFDNSSGNPANPDPGKTVWEKRDGQSASRRSR